ncbi:MAG TPA: regulatory protein RecX [Candidatus Limnocylindrales bacterium]|nr:regulatory protein RecX [Candidatus Limnocylindrales bacterium]
MSGRRRRGPSELARIREERAEISDPSVILEAALRFLEARQRSTVEVRTRLNRAGYRPDLVEGCIGRLTELGMLDDGAFARAWVESRDRARPRGERALRTELRMKGIDRDVIDETIVGREIERPEADALAAQRLLERHASTLARVVDPRARRQRAYALLARSGFDSETAVEAINGFLAMPDTPAE